MASSRLKLACPAFALILTTVLAACGSSPSSSSSPTATASTGGTASLGLISSGYLTVGSDATYPPQESVQPGTGNIVGTDADLANALAKAMGLKGAKLVNNAFATIIPSLQRHRFDVIMSSMNDAPDRRKQIDFVDYMLANEAILVTKSSGIHADSYSQLCGKTVAVESATTELQGLTAANKSCNPSITIKTYTADTDAFQAFKSGHADAYSGDLPVTLDYVKHDSSLKVAGKPFKAGEYYGIGLPKGKAGLKAALKSALAKIRASGEYSKILSKWGVASAAL